MLICHLYVFFGEMSAKIFGPFYGNSLAVQRLGLGAFVFSLLWPELNPWLGN